jgi:N-carbamoylputrescine amidase
MLRAALTETINAYTGMPATVAELPTLRGKLDAIREANVDHHVELMRLAREQGVQAICFGELFTAPYFALNTDPMWLDLAEDAANGPTVTRLRAAAREHRMIVVAPIYELDSSLPEPTRFNTAVVIDENGTVLGKFRKAHIPHGANEQGTFLEMYYYGRSDGQNGSWPANVSTDAYFPVFQTSVGRLGIAICYDRHFAGVMWTLAAQGAQLIFSPAVTFGNKSQRMWHLEFPVDAARHNVFIGGSNRRGSEAPRNQPYFGESYFTGPNGVLKNLSTHPDLVIADVDLEELSRPDPAGWNLIRDTRHRVVMADEAAPVSPGAAASKR